MSDEEVTQQSSFVTGFTLGLFAGAAGYFLFGTKKGGQVREQLVNDWEDAKEKLVEEGVIDKPDISLRELVGDLMQQAFSGNVNEGRSKNSNFAVEEGVVQKSSKTAKRKETARRFKGV